MMKRAEPGKRPGIAAACLAVGLFSAAPRQSWANPADPGILSDIRANAAGLRKIGLSGDTGIVLEYLVNRRSNECAGDWPESKVTLRGNGTLSMTRTRSHSGTGKHGPGLYAGRIGAAAWDSTFLALSRMAWMESPIRLPMPGISESHIVLSLFQGGSAARWEITGHAPPGQTSIDAGLAAAANLLRASLTDTLWSPRLSASGASLRGRTLRVKAVWQAAGKRDMRLLIPESRLPEGCGGIALSWFPTEGEAERRIWARRVSWDARKARQALAPGASLMMVLEFAVPQAGMKNARMRLVNMGLPVAEPGRNDTAAQFTLFSDVFHP